MRTKRKVILANARAVTKDNIAKKVQRMRRKLLLTSDNFQNPMLNACFATFKQNSKKGISHINVCQITQAISVVLTKLPILKMYPKLFFSALLLLRNNTEDTYQLRRASCIRPQVS